MSPVKHAPSISLSKALDNYADWLHRHFTLGIDATDERDSGAKLLRAIAEIRRHSCPGGSQLMTDLLLDHTKLSTLLFDHQLRLVRGQRSEPLIKSGECVSLIQRQSATILAMRSACALNRSTCIHTAPGKDAPQNILVRRSAHAELRSA